MDPTSLMATPARCLELQQEARALLNSASDKEVERVGGAYGVTRPLKKLRAALLHRLDLFQGGHVPDDLAPPTTSSPRSAHTSPTRHPRVHGVAQT